jgi:hypothetical protein
MFVHDNYGDFSRQSGAKGKKNPKKNRQSSRTWKFAPWKFGLPEPFSRFEYDNFPLSRMNYPFPFNA